MDEGQVRGVRGSVAMLAALGALLVGLAGGAALGGMLGYVAGGRAAGGDIVVPPAIERLGLLPRRPDSKAEAEPTEEAVVEPATGAAPEPTAEDNPADANATGGSRRSKGGQQASQDGARPRLGVEVDTTPLAVADYASGARVMSVAPGSAAAAAGIEVEDVVVSVDGQAVRNSDDLAMAITAHAAGDTVALVVLRGDAELTFDVTLGAADASTEP